MIGDLNEFFAADAEDPIHLLAQMSGWQAGQTGAEVVDPVLKMYLGELGAEGQMLASNDSFDADGNNLIQFPANITGCLVETERAPFRFAFPFEGNVINLNIEQAAIVGKVEVAETGINMSDTNISGYLTDTMIGQLITDLQTLCASENAPSFCADFAMYLNGDASFLIPLVASFAGGFDSMVDADGNIADTCTQGVDCNAVSICLNVASQATVIAGRAAE
jgi:hypothetical protein